MKNWRVGELVNFDSPNSSPIHRFTNALHSQRVRRQRGATPLRRRGRRRLLVDQLLELLARLEVRNLLRRHVHFVAGLRVTPLPRLAFAQAEAAESAQLDLLAAMQRIDDAA